MYDVHRLSESVERLLAWGRHVPNDLPWHGARDPYRVWISEIMLQQTRIAAVLPYYERFLTEFPTVRHLAEADDDRLMKCWEGLGYYSRARNLKRAAKQIVAEHGGELPSTAEQLRALAGIGPYTAGAIASISFGEAEPAVDGNVLRVMMRLFASSEDVLRESTKRSVACALRAVYPKGPDAGRLTEALMLLGERVCLPAGEVRCDVCPLAELCLAKQGQIVDLFPVRAVKRERRREERTVLLLRAGDRYALRRRPDTGLLAGMFEYPNVLGSLDADGVRDLARSLGFRAEEVRAIGEAKHIFSHVEWHMRGYEVTGVPEDDCELSLYGREHILSVLAVPSAFGYFTGRLRDAQTAQL